MSALGRERIVTVAVALADLAVPPLDEHLALLVDGDVPRTVDRLLLRVMDGSEAIVAFSPHTPLVFPAHCKYSEKSKMLFELSPNLSTNAIHNCRYLMQERVFVQ
jgi:hypothetical protein